VEGYSSLAAAAQAAVDGDIIEVRSDEPFSSAEIVGKKRFLVLRGGVGYRPICDGELRWSDDTLAVEGLEVRRGGISAIGPAARIERLANCAVQGRVEMGSGVGTGRSPQVVNCLLTGPIHAPLRTDQRLSLRNSVFPAVVASPVAGNESARVELEHCLCWNADSGPVFGVLGDKLHVTVGRTMFASVGGLVADPTVVASWRGRGNVYLLGERNWHCSLKHPFLVGLADWRRAWGSDADSTADDPPFFDPRQWRVLPSSPGSRQAPGGRDYGADVDRIAAPN
jgi:hypothetical protein